MYRTEGVLGLLALYLGVAQSFSWDVVVAGDQQLEFYDNNGTRTHIDHIPTHHTTSLAYDPVHNCVLFADQDQNNYSISSFNIATRKINILVRSDKYTDVQIAYDPITSLLFWTETGSRGNYSILSKASNAIEQNLLIKSDGRDFIYGITVDSCGGYIYWTTDSKIERARFDGSQREVVIDNKVFIRGGIAIDHQTQNMYWIDNERYSNIQITVESADLNGENRRTLFIEPNLNIGGALGVSKDYIYWRSVNIVTRLTRNPPHDEEVEAKKFWLAYYYSDVKAMACNYKIEDQTQGLQNCEAQKRLLPINSETNEGASLNVSTDVSLLCVHGTKVSGESRCECTQGYIGERCDVSVCHNYCLQGDCSVSAEGQPKCRCNASYSGKRCEVNACHDYCSNNSVCVLNEEIESVCECTGSYEGERCHVSVCHNYCFQGDCGVSADGQPKCRCNAGYSGERCEVSAFSTPTIATGAASYFTAIQELNNTLKGWRTDMDHAMVKFTDDIKGTLRSLREEMEISIMSKLNDNIKFTLFDMKQEMNTLRSELINKLKENVCTVAHDVSELKSSAQIQAAEEKKLKGNLQRFRKAR